MHIETNAAVQPTKDNVIMKLDLSLTDDEDYDLVKIMPILTPVATDNVSSREQVLADIKSSLPKYALRNTRR